MKIKTSELTGQALDWAVAKCEGISLNEGNTLQNECDVYTPSTDWAQGGPIIEREKIEIFIEDERWNAYSSLSLPRNFDGDTPLIAAMRCFVASKLGDEVDVPNEILKGNTNDHNR